MSEERPKNKSLPEKKFELREAPLSKVLKNEHVNTVHRFGIIVVFYLALNNVIDDLYNGGTSEFGFKLIRISFCDLHKALFQWLLIISSHFLLFIGWYVWRILRPNKAQVWDGIWICILLIHLFGGFHFFVTLMFELETNMVSRLIILSELTRFTMKNYAFIRTNCYGYLTKAKSFAIPTFSKFIYFSFAPTLIYKNDYPRWPTRNFKTMGKFLLEFFIIIYTLSLLEGRILMNQLQDFGKQPFTNFEIFMNTIDKIIPSFIAWILFARIILHTVQCFFAELLQFGDREFTKDWWNSKCISEFHLSWNIIVQDWLFYYVYKDFYEYVTPRNKFASRLAVYVLSMALHDVILMYAVNITCPIYIIFMTFSLLLTISKTTDVIVNKFTLFNVVLGEAILVIIPHLEFYAKQNCPQPIDDILYVPKLYTCYK